MCITLAERQRGGTSNSLNALATASGAAYGGLSPPASGTQSPKIRATIAANIACASIRLPLSLGAANVAPANPLGHVRCAVVFSAASVQVNLNPETNAIR